MHRVEVRVKGRLDQRWADWFGDLVLTHVEDHTLLAGVVEDEAALYGLVAKLRDLGLSLVSVSCVEDAGSSPDSL
jgi:hypothetical protein